jgi:hypothetical protein
VTVVLDCDDEVCRMGYGEIAAIQLLRQMGLGVRQSPGLRIGALICDDRAWVYAPTVLCVEDEAHRDDRPNAILLCREQAEELIRAICPPEPKEGEVEVEPEIGARPLSEFEVKRTEKQLTIAPPMKFDVARLVKVFQPYLQYVEVSLKGCSINRRQIQIPRYLLNLTGDEALEARLRTTFNLIERDSAVSDSALRKEIKRILDDLTCSLGEPWGRVMLRAKRTEFDAEIEGLLKKIVAHKKTVKDKLQEEIAKSVGKMAEAWVDKILEKPPQKLRKQVIGPPTREQALAWLKDELTNSFPTAEKLITEMGLSVHFRDVTYETLNNKDFREALRRAFPYVNWDKPFDEFDAAKSKEEEEKIPNS